MKFTLSWLSEHLDLPEDLTLARLEEVMTMAGLEVEEIDDPAAKLADFTVARIEAADQHPNADKLQVCRVATKDGELQIVCGALNARAGLAVAFAPLGTFIPGWGDALGKTAKPIRGVESHGMLCSEGELQTEDDPLGLRVAREAAWLARADALGVDHETARAEGGIVELPDDAVVGSSVAEALELEPVIDFEVTPNRPDWLGVQGIARDLAAAGLGAFRDKPITPVTGSFPCPVKIEIDDDDACPIFAGRVVRGLKNGPSPAWLQERLTSIGQKPINALVDVTNLLSIDRARPLHVYDVSKLTGPIRARLGRGGESFEALDSKIYEASTEMCVIADDARVLGLGGVMGGTYSGSSEETTDVFIESAYFDPLRTARTGRATGISSDAQYRFARGVDPQFVLPGLELATQLILDICGGEASEIEVVGVAPASPAPIKFDTAQVERLTGLVLKREQIFEILESLGFGVKGKAKAVTVTVPSWRGDVTGQADLVEEVARIAGFDTLPARPLPRLEGRRPAAMTPQRRRISLARRTLAARGLDEAVTWSFCRRDEALAFGGDPDKSALANPISSELDVMRPTPLMHLAMAVQKNADRGFPGGAFFEVGPAFASAKPGDQQMVAAGVRDPRQTRYWAGASPIDAFTVKADALAALEAAGAPTQSLQTIQGGGEVWHPGQSGVIQLGPKNRLAVFGALHPRVLKSLDVEGELYAFEVYLDKIPAPRAAGPSKGALHMSELMPLARDFAFVVDAAAPASDLIRAASGADKKLIAGVSVFDLFEGEAIGAGLKSIALEVTLQPVDATLDEAAIEAVSKKVIAAVEKATGARLRAS